MTGPGETPLCLANVLLPPRSSGLSAAAQRKACLILGRGRITAVAAKPPRQGQVIDAGGATVLPGFIDAHTHLELAAADFCTVNWAGARDREELLRRVRAVAGRVAPDSWVLGGHWDRARLSDRELPGCQELDEASGGHPVLLQDDDRSLLLLNSAALRLCRIEPGSAGAHADGVQRDERGVPTGRLDGPAARGHLAAGVVPPVSTYVRLSWLRALLVDLSNRGITEVHDIATYPADRQPLATNLERSYTDLHLIDLLQERGELPIRVGYRPPLQRVREHGRFTAPHAGDDAVFLAGYKLFLDDGWYSDTPAVRADEYRYPGAAGAAQLIAEAESVGAAVSVHACGDLGVAEALTLLGGSPEAARQGRPAAPVRPHSPHRIIHARRISPSDIQRCASLGAVIETQPWQVVGLADMFKEPRFSANDSLISPYSSLLDVGVTVAFGSDRRVGMRPDLLDADPLAAIQIAMTRSWDCEPQQPDQRLTADRAFGCACRAGAVAAGNGTRRGQIGPGMDADLVLLDGDPWHTEPSAIASLHVLGTISAGRIVYDADGMLR